MDVNLSILEKQASSEALLLRLQVRRPLNLWTLRLVVGTYTSPTKIKLLGEMKAWAYSGLNGLQLDTMKVGEDSPECIGHLIWAATMAWAIESTPCRNARLLAINDDLFQHAKLVRYFRKRGFETIKQVGSAPNDLPLRLVWGGAGTLMKCECINVYKKSLQLWDSYRERKGTLG